VSKLRMRIQDPSRSGVYRVSGAGALEDVLRDGRIALVHVALPAEKEAILRAIAGALGFPQWFGHNWDALEDCLTDLSWRPADGHVLLFTEFTEGDDLGILVDVLASCAEFWRERGRPFFAVFLDPQQRLQLPALHREE
jgi:RNAse (barnase) inhibitor barstar